MDKMSCLQRQVFKCFRKSGGNEYEPIDKFSYAASFLLGKGIYEDDLEKKEETLSTELEGRPFWQVWVIFALN